MATPTKSTTVIHQRHPNGGYGFPNDEREAGRLDMEDDLIMLGDRNPYPLELRSLQPRLILDVACGTGKYGYRLFKEFPTAQIINLDRDAVMFQNNVRQLEKDGKLRAEEHAEIHDGTIPASPRFLFIKADARKPLPFAHGTFDFTHARNPEFLSDETWPGFILECAGVTDPNGLVMISSFGQYGTKKQPSEAAERLFDAGMKLAALLRVTLGGVKFDEHLKLAGVPVQAKKVMLGKGTEQQELLLKDLLHEKRQLGPAIIEAGIMTAEEFQECLDRFEKDSREFGLRMPRYSVLFHPRDLLPR